MVRSRKIPPHSPCTALHRVKCATTIIPRALNLHSSHCTKEKNQSPPIAEANGEQIRDLKPFTHQKTARCTAAAATDVKTYRISTTSTNDPLVILS
jgi:hypothetical protein